MTARATVVAIGALLKAPSAAAAELPLGSRSLDERRESAVVAPGVRWTSIVREGGSWRVNVLVIDREALAGRLGGVLSNERVAGSSGRAPWPAGRGRSRASTAASSQSTAIPSAHSPSTDSS